MDTTGTGELMLPHWAGKGMLLQYPQGLVAERTKAVIHETKTIFPPAPHATVLYPNQFLDLWAWGRAVEEPWVETWRRLPLVLHDADLAEAVQIRLAAECGGVEVDDFTDTISRVLKRHPGPIQCLRLDCTACPGADLLREWVGVLSDKGVRELVLLNLTQQEQLEFPLHLRRSRSLATLALGFFGLSALSFHWCDQVASLQRLDLAGCRFSGLSLSSVVSLLWSLRILTIGCCDITAGCGRHGLAIQSRTLTKLHFWKCTATAAIVVNAPALVVLIVGVCPPPGTGRAAPVFIDLRSAQALEEIHHLGMHYHSLRIYSSAKALFNRRKVVSLPFMNTLDIGIKFGTPSHASALVELLANLPGLQELILWRVDDLPAQDDDEACSKAWTLHLVPPCISKCLEHLTIRSYRGGGSEIALVRRVLSAAGRLVSVTLRPHQSVPPEADAAAPFDICPKPEKCEVVVGLYEE